jgi:hypothetical protein
MYDFASGQSASASLLGGSEPPLSPEMVGSSPSFLEAPVPLKPIPTVMSTTTLPAPPSLVEALPVETAAARLVVRMLGGEELELGTFGDRNGAIEAAKELVGRFTTAEDSGDWPEMDGRFLRPGSVASIDVLVA